MGQCCTNQEQETEALKSGFRQSPTLQENMSRDGLDDLQLSEAEDSAELARHGPPASVAVKIRGIPPSLETRMEALARSQNKFDFNQDNQMVDKAVFLGLRQFSNQSVYLGQWYQQQRNGRGQLIYPDGSVYEGYWMNDKREGLGRFADASGDVYEGEWKNDNVNGKGKYTLKNGAYFIGDWVDNKQHGRGKEKWPTGEIYEGQYSHGNKHGKGVFRASDGSYFEGDFVDGKIEGRGSTCSSGEYHWQDGRHYIGEWVNNERDGRGEFFWPTGIRYLGNYKANLKEGKGKIFFGSEDYIEGEFVNNLLVNSFYLARTCNFYD